MVQLSNKKRPTSDNKLSQTAGPYEFNIERLVLMSLIVRHQKLLLITFDRARVLNAEHA
jgi:hypothetical protein